MVLFLALLCQNLPDYVPVHVREAAVGAVVAEGQLLVVEAEEVQDGGVDVVTLGEALAVGGLVAPFVALSVGDAALDAAAGEPVGEDEGIVVAALAALGAGHAAELGGPEDECVLEHAPILEVLDERRGALGHAERKRGVVTGDVFMGIPVATGKAVEITATIPTRLAAVNAGVLECRPSER